MAIINNLIQNLIYIIILAVFLEMLLPVGEMKKYVKMVMGLLIIVAVLQAAAELFPRGIPGDLPLFAEAGDKKRISGIIEEGERLSSVQMEEALDEYRKAISGQISGLVRLNGEVDIAGVDVIVESNQEEAGFGRIKEVVLTVTEKKDVKDNDGIKPVNVGAGSQSSGNEPEGRAILRDSAERIAGMVANFYNLSPEQVKVVYR
ncbi:MAG TPA: stage III sporulation protein AF [Bacillota bacterium]|nr:stage III sporulation protein AF [Bacillota bacterium]